MRRISTSAIALTVVGFTVFASAQGPATPVAAPRPATKTTLAKPTLSKAESDAVVAALRPGWAAYKKDKDAKKLLALASRQKGEARRAAMLLASSAIEQSQSWGPSPGGTARYTIESAQLDKIKAGKLPGCELTVEMTLRVRRFGPAPQGRVEIVGQASEPLATSSSGRASVEINAVLPQQDPNQTLISVPLVVADLPNKFMSQCVSPGFFADIAIVGGVAPPYQLSLTNGAELTLAGPPPAPASPPPPPPCNDRFIRCSVGTGSCVPEDNYPLGCFAG